MVETLNGNFRIKKNVELWKELMAEKRKFADIQFIWVKGHDKDRQGNEVDRQAIAEAKKARQL